MASFPWSSDSIVAEYKELQVSDKSDKVLDANTVVFS